ncbi:pyridoxamine 5'-phosphate oxidase family protein [Amycolatopsis alkalitolerans]|nr:pyridoxamine 5'-phosphate oxidase family protein [Amycolatopsis alkalitolerans]
MTSTAQIWREIERCSFAVVSHVTPDGAPRSSGVSYAAEGGRLYSIVAGDGWKARHLALDGRVAVTVPVHRGGILALLMPIPPATISFHGTATVRTDGHVPPKLESLLRNVKHGASAIIEIEPSGRFLTYGIGVPLLKMRDAAAARGVAPIGQRSLPA